MKYKYLFAAIAMISMVISSEAQVTGTFTDTRDGKTYKTVKIGTQTWLAEDLAYMPTGQAGKASSGCWAYTAHGNIPKNGCFYTWQEAQIACPVGWHLPSDSEWTILTDYLGSDSIAGKKLKSASVWDGSNGSKFSALPVGYYDGMSISNEGINVLYWTANDYDFKKAWYRSLVSGDDHLYKGSDYKGYYYAVRCIKN